MELRDSDCINKHCSLDLTDLMGLELSRNNHFFVPDYFAREQRDAHKSDEWYLKDSKCLTTLATEFVCKGLELNTSELFWGGDFVVHNGAWRIHPTKNTNALNKPFKIYTLFYCRGDALA